MARLDQLNKSASLKAGSACCLSERSNKTGSPCPYHFRVENRTMVRPVVARRCRAGSGSRPVRSAGRMASSGSCSSASPSRAAGCAARSIHRSPAGCAARPLIHASVQFFRALRSSQRIRASHSGCSHRSQPRSQLCSSPRSCGPQKSTEAALRPV